MVNWWMISNDVTLDIAWLYMYIVYQSEAIQDCLIKDTPFVFKISSDWV